MRTEHIIHETDARSLESLDIPQVHLVVTSPPYPMIEMWDEVFMKMNGEIVLSRPIEAFELMNRELDKVWEGVDKHLIEGGIVCVNIGNATRSINGSFSMFPSNVRITQKFMEMGYTVLPEIIWRKQSTAPNKFMGSGMLPPNAYVTQEHEYILIFRKGGMRQDLKTMIDVRRSSAYFWEERNIWFSDLWQMTGSRQKLKNASRERSAAFPFELPFRLINMFSIKGDRVLDPFMGTGTTSLAALASCRSSIGIELSSDLVGITVDRIQNSVEEVQQIRAARLDKHRKFVETRQQTKEIKHIAEFHKMPVVTTQERMIWIDELERVSKIQDSPVIIEATYK